MVPLTTKGGPKDIAFANYLLGYIYTCYDNSEEDEQKANVVTEGGNKNRTYQLRA